MLTREQLREETKSRAPWYQCIEFPEFSVATTDDVADIMSDQAWDNKIGGISIEEATRLRPVPKWQAIDRFLPDFRNKEVLEIGCNCGFWSFKFSDLGASSVLGLDVSPHWLENAQWCKGILKKDNVNFLNVDFMTFNGMKFGNRAGLLRDEIEQVDIPNDRFDIVFMSTVLDHLFFPLFAIYKMIRMAREYVIIDVPQLKTVQGPDDKYMKMGIPEDASHHGFVFTKELLMAYFLRMGLSPDAVEVLEYNNDANICYKLNVRHVKNALSGA